MDIKNKLQQFIINNEIIITEHNFNSDIESDIIPEGITSIKFNYMYNNGDKPLKPNAFPNSVKRIEFGTLFNQPINGVLKEGLQVLRFGDRFNNNNQPFTSETFPKSLTELYFGNNFNQSINGVINDLPNLKIIEFGDLYNNGKPMLEKNAFPVSIKSIKFGTLFNNNINAVLPKLKNLETITFGEFFRNGNYKFKTKIFPASLKEVIFHNNFSTYNIKLDPNQFNGQPKIYPEFLSSKYDYGSSYSDNQSSSNKNNKSKKIHKSMLSPNEFNIPPPLEYSESELDPFKGSSSYNNKTEPYKRQKLMRMAIQKKPNLDQINFIIFYESSAKTYTF
jgi:hypothetical protein